MGVGEEDPREKAPFLSYHFKGTYYQHDFSWVTLIIRLRSHLPGFSTDSALLFISLSKLCSLEGCCCGQAPFKEQGVMLQALQILIYMKKPPFCEDLFKKLNFMNSVSQGYSLNIVLLKKNKTSELAKKLTSVFF